MDYLAIVVSVISSGIALNSLILLVILLLNKAGKKQIVLTTIISLVTLASLLLILIYTGDSIYVEGLTGNTFLAVISAVLLFGLVLVLGYLLVKILACYDKMLSKNAKDDQLEQ